MNEWLEMDGIVLDKVIHDWCATREKEEEGQRAGREAGERARALWEEKNVVVSGVSGGLVSPAGCHVGGNSAAVGWGSGWEYGRGPSGESRVPEVFLRGVDPSVKSKQERINENCSVRDLRERIKGMKKWRREIERTVCWRLEEYRRIQKAIIRQSDQSEGKNSTERKVIRRVVQFEDDEGVASKGEQKEGAERVKTTGVHRDEGWGVGGHTWEKTRSVWLILLLLEIELHFAHFMNA